MEIAEVRRGSSPIILAFPHTGTVVPDDIREQLNDTGRQLTDTDWHVDRLYAGLLDDATIVRALHHRYVIDVNRDPTGETLYPGQNTTGLVPATDFDGVAIWTPGREPSSTEIARRVERFHRPYHAALEAEIDRVRARLGIAIVYDCHSIRSRIPFLFEGRLPDFNIGTDGGRTCAGALEAAAFDIAERAEGYSCVLNGRFRGGWTTRHYGRPSAGVHAIQMELAQSAYLTAEHLPFAYDEARAGRLRPHLRALLTRLEAIASELAPEGRND